MYGKKKKIARNAERPLAKLVGPPRCSEARETIRKRQGHRIVQEKDVNLRKKGKNVPRALLGRRSGPIKTAKRQTAANCAPVLLVFRHARLENIPEILGIPLLLGWDKALARKTRAEEEG